MTHQPSTITRRLALALAFFTSTAALTAAVVACGDSEEASPLANFDNNHAGNNDFNNANNANNASNANNANNSVNNASNNGFEPEPEERFNFRRPQASLEFVFVANTSLDSVAKINGQTLEITSIEVGDEPTVVRTWRETNTAVVLNEGSDEVSVIHAGAERDDVVNLPIRQGFNNVVIAPGGLYALAYLDYASIEFGEDIGAFQDVNLIRLSEGEEAVFNISVGFHVLEIDFDEDGEHAFVVTETGVSVIDMAAVTGDTNAQPRPVSDDPLEDANAVDREVEVTADGLMALVRTSVFRGVNLVALTGANRIEAIDLPGVPTDIDLYPDSSRAVVVIKDTRQVALIDLAAALTDPVAATRLFDVPEGPVGLAALDAAADKLVLYSIAEQTPRLVRLDMFNGKQAVLDVRKPVNGLALSPSGFRAVVFHPFESTPASGEAADQFIARSWAYTLIDLRSGFSKLQTTPAAPGEFAFSDDSAWIYMLLDDATGRVRQVERANLETFRVDRYPLTASPTHIGELPASSTFDFYVSQEHPDGRMTFFAIDSGEVKTVTGFELNAQIE